MEASFKFRVGKGAIGTVPNFSFKLGSNGMFDKLTRRKKVISHPVRTIYDTETVTRVW